MTYSQSFKGTLRFASAHCLEAGLDAFAAYDDPKERNALSVDDFTIDGVVARLAYENFLPASMSFGTCAALRKLAAYAASGTIRTAYEGDTTEVIRAQARRDDRGLPPRHWRWEMRAAVRAGDVKALRALLGAGAKLDSSLIALAKNRRMVDALVAAGADVNAHEKGGRLPIEIACDDRRVDVALALLAAGARLPPDDRLVDLLCDVARARSIPLLEVVARDARGRRALVDPQVIEVAIAENAKAVIAFLARHGAVRPVKEPEPRSFDDAAEAWNVGKYEECLAILRALPDVNRDFDVVGLEATALGFLGRYAEANATFEQSIELDDDNATWRNAHAYFLACEGRTRESKAEYERALAIVEKEIADEPRDASLLSRKAYALNGLGRSKDALAMAKKALALEPDDTLSLMNAGRALLDLDRPKEAREMLERAVQSDKKLPEPRLYLAIARARTGDVKGAKSVLAKATAVSPHLAALAKKEPSLAGAR